MAYLVLALAGCCVLLIELELQQRAIWNSAITRLLEETSKHNLSKLIELCFHVKGEKLRTTKARLACELYNIEPNDRFLSRRDFIRLNLMLRWTDVALVCAILHAIETVGSLNSLHAVSRLARGRLLARRDSAVKQTAISCMDLLRDQLSDPGCIGQILELMGRGDVYGFLLEDARRSLIVIFNRLTADDRHYLGIDERRLLYVCFGTRDVEFVLAVLKMAPRIGLLDALPYVTCLAEGKYSTNRNIRVLREQARVCQDLLGGRIRVLECRNTLLRSAPTTPDSRQELVRTLPAGGHDEPALLLRPVAGHGKRAK